MTGAIRTIRHADDMNLVRTRKNSRTLNKEEKDALYNELRAIQMEANYMLSICDYLMYDCIEAAIRNVASENEELGIIRKFTKEYGLLTSALRQAERLAAKCRLSEKLEMMPVIGCTLPCYIRDYEDEGGYFVSALNAKWRETYNSLMGKLHYPLRKILLNSHAVSNADFGTSVLKAYILCMVANETNKTISENMGDDMMRVCHDKYQQTHIQKSDLNLKHSTITEFESVFQKILKLRDYVVPDLDYTEHDRQVIRHGIFGFIQALVGTRGAAVTAEVFNDSVHDYTDYCIARLLIHYRSHKEIDPCAVSGLHKITFSDKDIEALCGEFSKTRICIDETDAHEMKMHLHKIKNSKHISRLRDILNTGAVNAIVEE